MMNKKTININLDWRLEWARKIKGPLCDGHADNTKSGELSAPDNTNTHVQSTLELCKSQFLK